MGVFDKWRQESSRERGDPDYWRIGFMPWGGDGGFRSLGDEWDKLEEPVDRETFEWNTGDLEGGKYRLMAIHGTRMRRPEDFGVKGWTMEVGEADGDAGGRTDDELERKVDALLAQAGGNGEERPEDPEALIKWMTLQNPAMMERYADIVVPAAWGVSSPGGGLGFDDFEKNPLGALMYDAYNNPEKLRKAGENVGAGFGAGLDGFFRGMDEPGAIGAGDVDQEPVEDDAEGWTPRRSSDAVAVDLDELGIDEIRPEDWLEAHAAAGEAADEPHVDQDVDADADQEPEPDVDDQEDAADAPATDEIEAAAEALE